MRYSIRLSALALASLAFAACAGKPKPEAPAPEPAPAPRAPTMAPAPTPAPSAPSETDAAAEAANRRAAELARLRAVIENRVHFDFDRSDLRPDARSVLSAKVVALRANPAVTLTIEGHADERGSDEYNLALGNRRANSARQYLIQQGIAASRLTTVSFGEERPVVWGHDESAWAMNRRDEFRITAGLQ